MASTGTATTWKDVTPLLVLLSQELPIGGMVQHPDFSLHRSMSAIELMDPKMDTGMCRDVLPTISERVSTQTLPLQMTLQHAARIMDTLLCQEMAHRLGCSMPTSIVTCLYLHDEVLAAFQASVGAVFDQDLSTISDENLITACVYTHSVAVLKCMRIFYNIVKTGDVYEDEDFCDYERYPSPKQEGGRLRLTLGDDVEEEALSKMLDFVTTACEQRVQTNAEDKAKDQDKGQDKGGWQDLSCRLNLRATWWNTMTALRPLCEKANDEDVVSMERIRTIVSTQLKAVEKQCALLPTLTAAVKESMEVIWTNNNPVLAQEMDAKLKSQEDIKLAKAKSEGNVNEAEREKAFLGTYDERESIAALGAMKYGIDHRVSREFIPAGPPRQKTELHVPTYALRYFQQQVSHLVAVVKCQEQVVSVEEFEKTQRAAGTSTTAQPRGTTTLQSMQDYMTDFVARKADIFSRSVLNLLLLGPLTRSVTAGDGTGTIREAMLLGRDPMDEAVVSNCMEYGILPWMLQSEAGRQSLACIIPATLNGFRLHCLSAARLHRRASHLLSEWGNLQNEIDYCDSRMLAESGLAEFDNRLYANRFGSYALDMSLELMREQLMLGFSLELYSINEMIHVHWYCGRLMHMQIQNRSAALTAYQQRANNPQPLGKEEVREATHQPDDFADTVMDVAGAGSSNKKGKKHNKNKKNKGKKGKRKNKKKNNNTSPSTTVAVVGNGFPRANSSTSFAPRADKQFHARKIHQLDMERSVSRAYQMSFMMMFRINAVPSILDYNLGTNELRFNNRFMAFHHFNQASPIRFPNLVNQLNTLNNASLLDLSEAIKKQFNFAASRGKVVLQDCPQCTKTFKKQMKALTKLCILNGIAMTKVLNSVENLKNILEQEETETETETEESTEQKEGKDHENDGMAENINVVTSNMTVRLKYNMNKVYSTFELEAK